MRGVAAYAGSIRPRDRSGRDAAHRRGRGRAWPHARRVRAGRREARPRAQPGRAGDVLAALERALRLQALQEAAAHAADRGSGGGHGPGGERRCRRRRQRDGLRLQGRVAQPPQRRRALPGCGHRVGGILRDIFALGARPIAVLDSLRFGEPTSGRSRYLLDRAVAGIGHYGNSIGVPTIGGEVYFEAPMRPTASSTRWRWASRRRPGWCAAPPPASATSSSCSARRPGATGSAAPPCSPAPSSARTTPTSVRRCRSAIRSRSPSCWSARWSCSTPGCSSRCRTSAPRG